MVYNNALCASMQILEECNLLCLLPSFNKLVSCHEQVFCRGVTLLVDISAVCVRRWQTL